MNKYHKLILGVLYISILLVFLYIIFSYIEFNRLNDFTYYKVVQKDLEKITLSNLYYNLFIFFLFCIIWITLLGFGSPLLIISGILFGKWIGTIISVFSISLGALFLYTIANYFFKDYVYKLLEAKFGKYIDLFKKNEFYYFLCFRLAGGLGIPFGLQNILPVIFGIKKINYFSASFFGFIPIFFIWNTIGAGLNDYVKEADSFSMINLVLKKEIYVPILLFVLMMFVSIMIKRILFDKR